MGSCQLRIHFFSHIRHLPRLPRRTQLFCYIYQGAELDNQFYKTKRTTFGYLVRSPASLRSSRVAPKEAQEPEEVEEVEEQQEPTGPVSRLDGHKKRSIAIGDRASLPSRSFSQSQNCVNAAESDHLRLFGVNCDNKVTLRNPSYEGCEDIELPQFDPNFMSKLKLSVVTLPATT